MSEPITNNDITAANEIEQTVNLSVKLALIELRKLSKRKRLSRYDRTIQAQAFEIVKKAIPVKLQHQIPDMAELGLTITHKVPPASSIDNAEKSSEIAK